MAIYELTDSTYSDEVNNQQNKWTIIDCQLSI